MRYVIAIFFAPLAVLMCGSMMGALVSLMLWVASWAAPLLMFGGALSVTHHGAIGVLAGLLAATVLTAPFMLFGWMITLIHAGMHIENFNKRGRIEEMNLGLRAHGKPSVPLPPKPEMFDWIFGTAAVAVFGWSLASARLRSSSESERARHVAEVIEEPPPNSIRPAISAEIPGLKSAGARNATLPDVIGRSMSEMRFFHDAPLSLDKSTAWAEWPSFRAHFTNGVVDEVQPR